jgi:DNA-directed RNA polymerase subunit RPC12/RpoP
MPTDKPYRCLNCGESFSISVLDRGEVQEARERGEQTFAIHCPKCNRTDLREGHEQALDHLSCSPLPHPPK